MPVNKKPKPTAPPPKAARHWGTVDKMTDTSRADGGYLTPRGIAELVGINRATVFAMIKAGELSAVRVGNRDFILRRDVEAKYAVVLGLKPPTA